MLPRNRILRSIEVLDVVKRGKTFTFGILTLTYTKSIQPFPSKFAVVLSKKSFKKAVDRNSIKRKLFKLVSDQKKIPTGYKVVLRTKSDIDDEESVKNSLDKFFSGLH